MNSEYLVNKVSEVLEMQDFLLVGELDGAGVFVLRGREEVLLKALSGALGRNPEFSELLRQASSVVLEGQSGKEVVAEIMDDAAFLAGCRKAVYF